MRLQAGLGLAAVVMLAADVTAQQVNAVNITAMDELSSCVVCIHFPPLPEAMTMLTNLTDNMPEASSHKVRLLADSVMLL